MNFRIAHPAAFALLAPLAVAVVGSVLSYAKVKKAFPRAEFRRCDFCFFFRTLFGALCGAFLIAALSAPSFEGAGLEETGAAESSISLVFDISHSMEARDAGGDASRLEAARDLARALLRRAPAANVSVVLAKGIAVTAVPETRDFRSVEAVLNALSPGLMTSEGSNPGEGVRTALSTFSEQFARSKFILLFTDGEELVPSLAAALEECARERVPVAIAGFGTREGTEVLAGDGVTKVRSALRADRIDAAISGARAEVPGASALTFVDFSEGNALERLSEIIGEGAGFSYETRYADAEGVFVLLSILSFILAVFLGQISRPRSRALITALAALVLTSCSPGVKSGAKILEGKLEWEGGRYEDATASYLEAAAEAEEAGDDLAAQYAVFGLAASYLSQGEDASAARRFAEVAGEGAPARRLARGGAAVALRYESLYNLGVIAARGGNYDDAVALFKECVLLNRESTDAKINLEISLRQQAAARETAARAGDDAAQEAAEAAAVLAEDNTAAGGEARNAIYSIIKEEEGRRWGASRQRASRSSLDY